MIKRNKVYLEKGILYIVTVHFLESYLEKKEKIWLSPMTKAPTSTEKFQKAT